MTTRPSELGNLRVFTQIGQGGMGAVYSGFSLEAQEFVAIKTLFRELRSDAGAVARFQHECGVSARLEHTNVVRFFGSGEAADVRYLALEYVRGSNMRDLIEGTGKIHPARVVEFMEDAAQALSHVHEKGLIHRDVKPENVIINQDGVLKLIDFGVALDWLEEDDLLGEENAVVGTCGYAPPEQNQGQEVGPQADLYSLGALAWNALVGRRWAKGNSPFEIAAFQMTTRPEAPSSLVPGIPKRLDKIVLRLLEKEPSDRYADAKELQKDLASLREDEEKKTDAEKIFLDPLAEKWSVAKRSFYEKRYALSKSLAKYIADRRPEFAPVHFLLGKLFALEKREFNATDSFRRAMELDPENLEYPADFALSLYRMNMFGLAKTELETLAKRAPKHALAKGFLGLVAERIEAEKPVAKETPKQSARSLADEDRLAVASQPRPGATDAAGPARPAPPPEPRTRGPATDPETVRGMSWLFPGLGRLRVGDAAGGAAIMGKTLMLLALLVLCLDPPSPHADGWSAFFADLGRDYYSKKADDVDFVVQGGMLALGLARAVVGLVAAGLALVLWRREAAESFEAARILALQGSVTELLAEGRVRVDLGTSRGAAPGTILEIYRLLPPHSQHFRLAACRLEAIGEEESVGEYRLEAGVTMALQVGDPVRLLVRPKDA